MGANIEALAGEVSSRGISHDDSANLVRPASKALKFNPKPLEPPLLKLSSFHAWNDLYPTVIASVTFTPGMSLEAAKKASIVSFAFGLNCGVPCEKNVKKKDPSAKGQIPDHPASAMGLWCSSHSLRRSTYDS